MTTLSCRPMLRRRLPAAVVIALLFPAAAAAGPAPAVHAAPGGAAATQADDPLPERPPGTGSSFDQLRAYTAVLVSREYRAEVGALAGRDRAFHPDDVIVNVEPDHGFAAVTVYSNEADYSVAGIFFVGVDSARVIGKRGHQQRSHWRR